jgi:hypothetical protein
MLIDSVLPRFHAFERHEIVVDATPDELWGALETADLAQPLPIRVLMGLRAIPAWLSRDGKMRQAIEESRRSRLTLRRLADHGFQPLAEEKHEIVFGIEGRFWKPVAQVRPGDLQRFRAPVRAGDARAAWNFLVEPVDAQRSRLLTITRIECADRATLRSFRTYWFFVRPFSGLIRILMLRAVRAELLATRLNSAR